MPPHASVRRICSKDHLRETSRVAVLRPVAAARIIWQRIQVRRTSELLDHLGTLPGRHSRLDFERYLGDCSQARKAGLGQALGDVILEPSIDARVRGIATATKNTKQNKAPFRHICFYGPP